MAWKKWEQWDMAAGAKKGLVPGPLVLRLAADPGNVPEYFVMQGLLGPAAQPDTWRLYRTHALDDYYEIEEQYIVWADAIAEGHRVWILRGSPMLHVEKRARPAEVDYLSGPMAEQVARRETAAAPIETVGGPEPTACPPCPSRSP